MCRDMVTAIPAWAAIAETLPVGLDYRDVAVREAPYSWLIFLAPRGERKPSYCLKIRKPGHLVSAGPKQSEQLPAAGEYKALVAVRDHFQDSPQFSDSAGRNLQFFEKQDAILMDYLGEGVLKEKLPRLGNLVASTLGSSRLRSICEQCGAWLAHFHSMKAPDWLPVRPSDLEGRLSQALSALPDSLLRRLPVDRLREEAGTGERSEARLAVSHGDFQPGNVLVPDGRVRMMDFGTAAVRPIEEDLAFFIVMLFAQKERVLYGSMAGTAGLMHRLCDAFLSGYGLDMPAGSPALRPMIAVRLAERLAQMCASIERSLAVLRPVLTFRVMTWANREIPLLLGWK